MFSRWNTLHRCRRSMALAVIALIISSIASNPTWADESTDAAIAKIRLLGGKVHRDNSESGRPIKTIDFSWSERFDDKYVHILKQFSSITKLNLFRTRVTDQGIRAIRELNLPELTEIDLGGCESITDESADEFHHFPKLTSLSLRETKITTEGVSKLVVCKQLTALNLYGCRGVDDAVVEDLLNFEHLTVVGLGRTRITDNGLQQLSNMTKLQQLDLRSARVSSAAINKLKSSLPELHVQASRETVDIEAAPRPGRQRFLDLIK